MKISIKHNNTEIIIDDNSDETTIKYSKDELIKILEKMSLEMQAIENNYHKSLDVPQPTPIHVGGFGIAVGSYPQICSEFVVDSVNTSQTRCMRCNMEKWQHPSKSIIAGM
jgi:hypothetical protein